MLRALIFNTSSFYNMSLRQLAGASSSSIPAAEETRRLSSRSALPFSHLTGNLTFDLGNIDNSSP